MTQIQENTIVVDATLRMIELGTESAQRYAAGMESVRHDKLGGKIYKLLKAYRKRDDLTEVQAETIVEELNRYADALV